jgi:hypothetical protein
MFTIFLHSINDCCWFYYCATQKTMPIPFIIVQWIEIIGESLIVLFHPALIDQFFNDWLIVMR